MPDSFVFSRILLQKQLPSHPPSTPTRTPFLDLSRFKKWHFSLSSSLHLSDCRLQSYFFYARLSNQANEAWLQTLTEMVCRENKRMWHCQPSDCRGKQMQMNRKQPASLCQNTTLKEHWIPQQQAEILQFWTQMYVICLTFCKCMQGLQVSRSQLDMYRTIIKCPKWSPLKCICCCLRWGGVTLSLLLLAFGIGSEIELPKKCSPFHTHRFHLNRYYQGDSYFATKLYTVHIHTITARTFTH